MKADSSANKDSAVKELTHELNMRAHGDVRTDEYSRILYSTDASIYQVKPYGVFIPEDTDEIQAAVELANKYAVPILPRAGGSSLAGQAVNEALIIDVSKNIDRILEVNREERWVRVQPGVVLDHLNEQLAREGLLFGPDPASSNRACMGGVISNNATGSHSILYGMSADHVLEMDVFLSDGSAAKFNSLDEAKLNAKLKAGGLEGKIYQALCNICGSEEKQRIIREGTPKHWRRCGGYNLDRFVNGGVNFHRPQDNGFNLAKLVSGAEGTLAVIKEMKLGLVERPKMTALAVVHFSDLHQALCSVEAMLEVGPSAIELLDNLGLTLCRQVPEYARMLPSFVEGDPYCLLLTEFYGESEAELLDKIEKLKAHMRKSGVPATTTTIAMTPVEQKRVWDVRKVGLGLMMSIKGDHKPIAFIEDASVPVTHLDEYITELEKFSESLGTKIYYYAHASAGCLHVRPLINAKLASEIEKLPQIAAFSAEMVKKYGGTISSEHGDGRSRSWLNEQIYGKDLYGLFREVKATFDPKNLLNPGNIVDSPKMTENLRYGPEYEVKEGKERISFAKDQGFARAIEMCNGAAVCRKLSSGTMCPSFMVTREEEHSTRGRANALRAAISGELPIEELTSKRMYEVMDLCIECKACKGECPSSVDMAKIKFEFLARYYERHGVPLRAKMFAGIARASRVISGPLAPIVNKITSSPNGKKILEKALGVSSKRTFPPFARVSFEKWFKNRGGQDSKVSEEQTVVLFADTFHNFNYPHVAIAATEFLEAAGFNVVLSNHGCCGRPMISKGLVGQATAAAKKTVERLAPFVAKGIPVVGLEPSCLLTLRDEILYLLPDDPRTEQIASHSYLFEEFIAKLSSEGTLNVSFSSVRKTLLLHGHCHQKSLVGTGPTKQALQLPENYSVQEIDSGCCGMAGSFGYEAEHYDISLQMGQRKLFPAVNDAGEDTVIVAPGVSCRQQIQHATGRRAYHPAEVLRDAIDPNSPSNLR